MGQRPAELVMGSVQLGLSYGVANRVGKPAHDTAIRLVRRAVQSGITQFDTARAYGDAEERLGEALGTGTSTRIITKLSPLSDLPDNATRESVRDAVRLSVETSLHALKADTLDCVLLHRATHRTLFGGAVWQRLLEYQRAGTIESLGVSVQSPAEALDALGDEHVQHIQMPFNILDWRWREAGVIEARKARPGLTLHARSIFLQGLLVADDPRLWPKIDTVDAGMVNRWLRDTVQNYGRDNAADLCLAFARGQSWIDGVVVGMETEEQLATNMTLVARAPLNSGECDAITASAPRVAARLLDPAQWPRT